MKSCFKTFILKAVDARERNGQLLLFYFARNLLETGGSPNKHLFASLFFECIVL